MEKNSINPYLLNLIFEFFAPLRSISCVHFFCNVHATIINLAYFNPRNLQLAD